MDLKLMLFQFLGGLGLFLFAIKYMGDGLRKIAGNRLRRILDKFTTNPIMGVLVGAVVTAIVQSSTASTVITIGLVNAGLMTLRQSIGVIMGANIGTTITAFIIGFDVGAYAYPMLALGGILLFIFNKEKIQNIGQIIFGFAGLFIGLELMGTGMSPLGEWKAFNEFTLNFSEYPVLGVIVGIVLTIIVQSSSATVGILQEMYEENLISLESALPIILGDNIGTTITAVLASITLSTVARRAAFYHLFFNMNGTIIFMVFLPLFISYVEWITATFDLGEKMQIAFAHGTFNIVNTLIQLPFIGLMVVLLTKILPGDESVIDYGPKHLGESLEKQSPSIVLMKVKDEVVNMGEMAVNCLQESRFFLNTGNHKHIRTIMELEEAINKLEIVTTGYLVKLSKEQFSKQKSKLHFSLYQHILDIQRISDIAESLMGKIKYRDANRVKFSEEAEEEVNEMFNMVLDTVGLSILALDKQSVEFAMDVISRNERIVEMDRLYRKKHISRINDGICYTSAGIIYGDIIDNLKRISDHAVNIAETIIKENVNEV